MRDQSEFIDHYKVLEVDPLGDERALETAYHYFAKMYHPDNAETADLERFNRIVESYRVLRSPDTRAAYDREYDRRIGLPKRAASIESEGGFELSDAAGDADAHEEILLRLYRRRRESALEPGVGGMMLQEALGCSNAEMDFHLWFLKSKGMVEVTEQGMMAITITGVEHVLATSREDRRQRLLEARTPDLADHSENPEAGQGDAANGSGMGQ
jgi:curved DNA-binding protein